jgi:hypothetical protein
MKLSVISEVANPKLSSMDGVEANASGSDFRYTFSDPKFPEYSYNVVFEAIGVHTYCPFYDEIVKAASKGSNSYKLDLQVIKDGSPFWSFDKTGAGNFGFVYGKLMACVIDFFLTRGVEAPFVMFSGYTKDMELVYKRIMDRLNSEHPEYSFYPYTDDLFVSAKVINKIDDEKTKAEVYNIIKTGTTERDDQLKMYKKMKRERSENNRGYFF